VCRTTSISSDCCLERLGLGGHRLTDKEIIALYQSCFLSEEARKLPLSDGLIAGANSLMVSTRDSSRSSQYADDIERLLEADEEVGQEERKGRRKVSKKRANKEKIPDFVSVPELIAPSSVQIFPWYMRIDGELGQEFVRTLAFVNYPRLVSAIRSLDFRALPAHWQHHAGFLSCLPQGDNQLGRGRLFGTSSAATFYPFTGSDISMDTGVMFGVHPNGSLIILNPFNSSELENANLVVFAKSGAGKSFFLKTVASRLLTTCNVYVVDPEAEYNNLCQRVKGQYIRLSSESLQLNPLELYGHPEKTDVVDVGERNDRGNFFREKLLNLITLLELLLCDGGMLTQKEKAFLYRCLVKTYENRGITMDPQTHGRTAPNMHEFYVIMSSALRGDTRFGVNEDTYGLIKGMNFCSHCSFSLRNRCCSLSHGGCCSGLRFVRR